MNGAHALLSSELYALKLAGKRWGGALRDSVERVCTGCKGLIRTHAVSYRIQLNALLRDA